MVDEVENRPEPRLEAAIQPELVDLFGAAEQAFSAPFLDVIAATGELRRALDRDRLRALRDGALQVELDAGRGRQRWLVRRHGRLAARGALDQAVQARFERADLIFDVAARAERGRAIALERVLFEAHVWCDDATTDAERGRIGAQRFQVVTVGGQVVAVVELDLWQHLRGQRKGGRWRWPWRGRRRRHHGAHRLRRAVALVALLGLAF